MIQTCCFFVVRITELQALCRRGAMFKLLYKKVGLIGEQRLSTISID